MFLIGTYTALAILGCGYVILSAFLGHVGTGDGGDGGAHGDGGHGEGGGGDGHAGDGHYGIDGTGHGATGVNHGAGAAAFHFPFFSPLALSTIFGSVGAYGLIAKLGLGVGDNASILIAVPAALGTAYLVTYASFKVISSSRGSSQIRNADLAGAVGEVLTPIPAGGVGEVAAFVQGQRFTSSAREASGTALARGTAVVVVRMVGSTLVVKREEHGQSGG